MKLNLRHFALLLAVGSAAVLLAFPAFAGRKRSVATVTAPTDSLSYNDRRRFDYLFLEAVRQQNAGHYTAAFDLLSRCLSIHPKAAEAYYMEALYFSQLKNDSMALANLEKAAALRPDNSAYVERVGQFYINTGNYDKAIEAYEKLCQNNRENEDALNILVQLYTRKKDYQGVLRTLNRLEELNGSNEETTLSKVRAYEMMDNRKAAYNALKRLSEEHPNDPGFRLMLGNWLMQNERQKEAYRIFIHVLEEEPDNAYAQASLYDYYRAKGQDSLAVGLREKMLLSSKTETQSKLTLLKQIIQDNENEGGDSTKVLHLFERILQTNPTDGDIAELQAAYMTLKQMPDSLINKALEKVLAINPDNAGARLQLIQNKWKQKSWDEVIALSKPAQAYHPDEMAFYYFMGVAYYEKSDKEKALDAFRRGVSEINPQSNKNIVSDFYAIMGDILHQKGRADEAFAAYDSCLQWKPDNIECLNNYAYYLSESGKDLSRAEAMSHKTIQHSPTNATYLDTYAWILFLQKRYSEAQTYIDQALANDTDSVQSAVVIEHAGDIYAMNGKTDRAVEYWKKALEKGGGSALLSRKIKLKKYIK